VAARAEAWQVSGLLVTGRLVTGRLVSGRPERGEGFRFAALTPQPSKTPPQARDLVDFYSSLSILSITPA